MIFNGFKLTAKTSVPPSGTRILQPLPKEEISQDNRSLNPEFLNGEGEANLVLITVFWLTVPAYHGGWGDSALDIRSTPSVPLILLSLLSLTGIKAGRLGHT